MENQPLSGRCILVTRPREQADALASRIEKAGGRAFLFAAMEIDPPSDLAAAQQVVRRLASFDLAIFVSPTAVQKGLALADTGWPPRLPTAAVGGGTRAELERRGISDTRAPEGGADSEALLALPALRELAGKKVVIFRGEGGRELLADTLVARGALVEHAICYRRSPPRGDIEPLTAALRDGAVHAVTSSSSAGLANLLAALGEDGASRLRGMPLFVSHARIQEQGRRLGMREIVLAGSGDGEMLNALVAYFASP